MMHRSDHMQRDERPVKKPALAFATAALLMSCIVGTDAQARPSWRGEQASLNAAEDTICSTRSLWGLDDQLNNSYQSALDVVSARDRSRLQSSQRDWLRARNGCGASVGCLRTVYGDRIRSLDAIVNRGGM